MEKLIVVRVRKFGSKNSAMGKRLVFQEGKTIDGDRFVASVYEDLHSRTLECILFNLVSECVRALCILPDIPQAHSLELTFSQFDSLFQFHTSLLAPWSSDSRYHILVERLDLFPDDAMGSRKIFVSTEPTKDASASVEQAKGESSVLTRSESARKNYIQNLILRRNLEDIMCRQRIVRVEFLRDQLNQTTRKDGFAEGARGPNHIVDVKGVAVQKHLSKVQAVLIEKARKAERKTSSTTRAPAQPATITCQSLDVSIFAKGEQLFQSRLIEQGKVIAEFRFEYLSEKLSRRNFVESAKKKRWLEMQSDSVMGFRMKMEKIKVWDDMETKRDSKIIQKRTICASRYGLKINLTKTEIRLELKHLSNRIRESRARMLLVRREELEIKSRSKRDSQKLNIVRNRNIEIKLEIRDRKLKEIKWRSEREIDSNPKFIPSSGASVSESYASKKSSNITALKIKEEAELAEKHAFLQTLERTERMNDIFSRRPQLGSIKLTPAQVEVERAQNWKKQMLIQRENICCIKQKRLDGKRNDARRSREEIRRIHEITNELDSKRCIAWTYSEKLRNAKVVNSALSRVSLIDELIPTLALF